MLFSRKKKNVLNGAWEERGVIGTRIEIDAPHITVLWRNAPVLETTFSEVPEDGGTLLVLKACGLRYADSGKDYATLTRLFYRDGKLETVKDFPITGEDRETLEKTEHSRFGDYTIVDERLGELRGEWKDEHGIFSLTFSGDRLTANERTIRIHLLHANRESGDRLKIADADPSKYEVLDYGQMEYLAGKIIARPMIFDAPPVELIFHKV